MTKRKSILVVGGGTAGWITLSYLASTLDADFTIIHSDEIDIIGVGESTTPTVKHVADTVGLDESEWMRDGQATFKYGIEFINFAQEQSRWFHSFDDLLPAPVYQRPLTEFGKIKFNHSGNSVELFLSQYQQNPNAYNIDYYNNSHGSCNFLLDKQLSPYSVNNFPSANRFPGYAYHINAFKFGQSLKSHTPAEKYREIVGTITHVETGPEGVKHVQLNDGTKLSADLYIDCTGFHRVLINHFSHFQPYKELRNNAAVWGPVKNCQIYRPSTLSIGQPHGWIWETPTQGQIGSGYTYCSDFINEQQAIDHLSQHWKKQGYDWEPLRSIKYQSGMLSYMAYGNVISNGLGQSFIEPLEATSIMTTCSTVVKIRQMWNKHQGWSSRSSEVLNTVMRKFLSLTKDFVVDHYTLSDRRDTEYWRSYDRTDAVERTCNMIKNTLEQNWANEGETIYNSFNWASMLIGYNKPYLYNLPTYTRNDIENYEFITKQIIENYQWLHRNNLTIQEKLNQIYY